MFEKLKTKLLIWSVVGNYTDFVRNTVSCVVEDSPLSRFYRWLFGMDRWCMWASRVFTRAEDYMYRIESLGEIPKEYMEVKSFV